MQDIVFYVAAKETLGKVRDYSNMRNSDAPLLTLGVAVCLRMRLFDDIEVSTPYPIASFNGITDWQWSMDDDFNRSTACTLVADAGGISVQSVTDTVNGETMNFTEFVIQISNMNTEKLAAWLGNEGTKSGLTGELVGYDNGGHAVFVLQIEDFSVRNRVAGLGDPTALDQEIVTRTQAEQMIQTAVSAFDASKQDKLTSTNAGTGISISNTGVISVENVSQSAVSGLSTSLASKQDKLTSTNAGTGISISNTGVISVENVSQSAVSGLESTLRNKQNSLSKGFWIEIDDDWISVERYHTIHGPYSSNSVTLQAGEAYKIYATNSVVTLNKGNIPNNTWGIEGHLEIFVAGTGYIHTGDGVVLANALEPDAVNNCTVRFHDGFAIISVEDHVAGYIVTVNAASGAGSLNYGLATASNEYISIDASLNGQTFDLADVVTSAGEKHVVGNGYTETIISGGITCTSKTTFSDLSMGNVVNSGGTMTLGDVHLLNGATVSVSGALAVENVVGDESTIDLGGTAMDVSAGWKATVENCSILNGSRNGAGGVFNYAGEVYLSGCTVTNCSATGGGAFAGYYSSSFLELNSCVVTGNTAPNRGGGILLTIASANIVSSIVSGNTAVYGPDICMQTSSSYVRLEGSTIGTLGMVDGGGHQVVLDGYNKPYRIYAVANTNGSGTVFISSGAVVDFTGNALASPITPGVGVTFAPGGAQVYPSAGMADASYIDNLTFATVGNNKLFGLGGTSNAIPAGSFAFASNAIISGGTTTYGGCCNIGGTVEMSGCSVVNCSANGGGAFMAANAGKILLTSTVVSGCSASTRGGAIYIQNGGSAVLNHSDVGANSAPYAPVCLGGSNCYLEIDNSTTGLVYSVDAGGHSYRIRGNCSITQIRAVAGAGGDVTIEGGAVIALTYYITPGGTITVQTGGCTVNGHSIAAGTYTSIQSDGSTTAA